MTALRVRSFCTVVRPLFPGSKRNIVVRDSGGHEFSVGVSDDLRRPLEPNDRVLVDHWFEPGWVIYIDERNTFINGAGI